MCGIMGYTGGQDALDVVIEGLGKLEYRGYDSAGVAVVKGDGSLVIKRSPGKLSDFCETLETDLRGETVIGHTRWATHGKPTELNAHPHADLTGSLAVVHNGIVENYQALRDKLESQGFKFKSETDTEVISMLMGQFMSGGKTLEEALVSTADMLDGAQAIVVTSSAEKGKIVGVRIGHAGGLVIGFHGKQIYLSSDLSAIASKSREVVYLEHGEMVVIVPGEARFKNLSGKILSKKRESLDRGLHDVAKGQYSHFMLKEIMEQPEIIIAALRDRINFDAGKVGLRNFPFTSARVKSWKRVYIIGMGTSYHAAQIGRRMFEQLTRIPTEADNASEFRYRDPGIDESCLVVSITQSGETADTLLAMVEAQRKGASQVAVSNVHGSQATRIADYSLQMNAGLEVSVASTKTFTGALVCIYLLGLLVGDLKGVLSAEQLGNHIRALIRLPQQLGKLLDHDIDYRRMAGEFCVGSGVLFLGRGVQFPVAMEGALKFKEVSYVHAEGYPAGEMKHGPIALVSEDLPVVVISLKDRLYRKMISNIEEVKSRGGKVLAVATEGDDSIRKLVEDVIYVPETDELLSPIVTVAPLQLLAYHAAMHRGCDIDQPRNLAKTVTVE